MARKSGTTTTRKGRGTPAKAAPSSRARERDKAAVRRRPGKRPADYTAFLQVCLGEREHREAVIRVLRDPDHRHFATVLRDALDRVFGRPVQPHEHAGRVELVMTDDTEALRQRAAEAEDDG
ncbi:MAG: hypothetical protein AB7P61_13810 [Gemmatimonadales bacterium]